jgi:hypothetical protein
MSQKKIPPEKEAEIIAMLRQPGMSYQDVANVLKEKYDISVTRMALCKLVKRTKEYLTNPELVTCLQDEQKATEAGIANSLNHTIEVSMSIYEELMDELRNKKDVGGFKSKDLIVLNLIADRLMRLRQVLFPAMTVTKELSLTKQGLKNDYVSKTD